jgi:hypothetical protein
MTVEVLKGTAVHQARPAPSPLVGEGWGEGWQQTPHLRSPPSLSLPHKGGGNVVALPVVIRAATVR